jgi:hypothetical protein
LLRGGQRWNDDGHVLPIFGHLRRRAVIAQTPIGPARPS